MARHSGTRINVEGSKAETPVQRFDERLCYLRKQEEHEPVQQVKRIAHLASRAEERAYQLG